MNAKRFCSTVVVAIMALISLFGCSTPQKAYLIGTMYEDDIVNATIISADFTDKIIVNGNDIAAPVNGSYLIVDMEMSVKSGNWHDLSDFEVGYGVEYDVSFERNVTTQINGCDLLEINSTENQSIRLAFLIMNADVASIRFHTFTIRYAYGGSSELFALSKTPEKE